MTSRFRSPAALSRAVIASIALSVIFGFGAALLPHHVLIKLGQNSTPTGGNGQSGVADKMMMPNPFSYEYIAGESLSDEKSSGHVYKLALLGDAKSVLSNIAKLMKITGDVYEPNYSTAEYPTYAIGKNDGTEPSASINWSGTGNWWFNNPAAYPPPVCLDWQKSDDGTEFCSNYEGQKPNPELQPSKIEAIAEALRLFNATGLKVGANDITVTSNDWGTTAIAALKIGGTLTPIEWSVTWSITGDISSVSGNSVTATDLGSFATISPKAAVARMSDWRYFGQAAQSIWNKYQPVGGGVIAYSAKDTATDAPADQPSATPSEIISPEPLPSPTIVKVTINKFELAQLLIWDKSGGAWLVPGCVLVGDEGWISPVFTLEEGVVELPEPIEVSPMVK